MPVRRQQFPPWYQGHPACGGGICGPGGVMGGSSGPGPGPGSGCGCGGIGIGSGTGPGVGGWGGTSGPGVPGGGVGSEADIGASPFGVRPRNAWRLPLLPPIPPGADQDLSA